MERIAHNPTDGIYPADDYVHAIEVRQPQRIVYLAGTMGLRPDGAAGADIDEQLELVWNNIRRILADADMTTDNIVRVTSYLRDSAYVEKNAQARLKALGNRKIPTTAIVAQTLVDDWLVEIEVIAAA
ncbi:MAG: RidA family protein [Rhizobiaceae bacterium]|nr:RidA family protein [Rhizobiaceae bacterium]MCV0405856.1 RidA family protein [Rhizobiaceae bacterium]